MKNLIRIVTLDSLSCFFYSMFYRSYSAVRYSLSDGHCQICIKFAFLSLLFVRLEVFQCLEREKIRETEEKTEEENHDIWKDFKQIYRP